jgi:hypothetical protein
MIHADDASRARNSRLRIGVRTRLDIGVASVRCDIVDDWVLGHNWGSAGSVAAVDL